MAAALATIDAAWQPSQAIIGIVVLAPLLTVLVGATRDVLLVGAVAIALCALSALWHDNFGELTYLYRIGVVGAVTALAVLLARGRRQVSGDRERFALLAAIDLAGWKLVDRDSHAMTLDGVIGAGETLRVALPHSVMLPNGGGVINLLAATGLKVDGVAYTGAHAAEPGRTVVF